MIQNPYEIKKLDQKGILAEMGVGIGDKLLSINDTIISDELDIYFGEQNDELLIKVEKPNGEIWELEIEKDEDEDLGLVQFDQSFGIRRCQNQCIFCFIDQMPPGMRETLYVKDDDERLSFLQGNYVTLTNLSEDLLHRIVKYHINPINISIHTTNPDLRCQMLKNRKASRIMTELTYLSEHHIQMNGQIVLCPGYNDGEELIRTLNDLMQFYPALNSISVVPVGLSEWRNNLPFIKPVSKEKSIETLQIIDAIQSKMLLRFGTRFVFGSDEFYLSAGCDIPDVMFYEDFSQIENGVGMLTDFSSSLEFALNQNEKKKNNNKHFGIITGCMAFEYMESCTNKISKVYPNIDFDVYPIINTCFGRNITVSGLVTGKDILEQIQCDKNIDAYFIPENMVRYHTNILLDDVTTDDIAKALASEIIIVPIDGESFLEKIKEQLE